MQAIDRELNRLTGLDRPWWRMISAAVFFPDKEHVVTEVVSQLIMDLNNPENRLAVKLAGAATDGEKLKVMNGAIWVRARAVSVGLLRLNRRQRPSEDFDGIPSRSLVEETGTAESLKRRVMDVLKARQNKAKGSRQRWVLCQKVAEVRMNSVDKFVSLKELMKMFPQSKKTTIHNVLLDIKSAAREAMVAA